MSSAALACACALLAAGCGSSGETAPPPTGPASTATGSPTVPAPTAAESPLARLPEGWTRLARPPIHRASAAAVWTGSELILWGGDTQADAVHHADGARWNAATDAWTQLPGAPIAGRSQPAAAWTGGELLVWGGTGQLPLDDGAAYNPATDEWRELPPAPLPPRVPVVGAWTGREFLVWGDKSREQRALDGAAYDPAADRWRLLAPAPVALNLASGVWTGRELVVVGSALDHSNRADAKTARALAYDPEADSWRILPAPPLSPQASTAALTGDEDVLAWDYELRATSWTGDGWHDDPSLPLDLSECYPQSAAVRGGVVGWYCGAGAFFDTEIRRWSPIPPKAGSYAGPIAAGPVALFVGPGLWAYRP